MNEFENLDIATLEKLVMQGGEARILMTEPSVKRFMKMIEDMIRIKRNKAIKLYDDPEKDAHLAKIDRAKARGMQETRMLLKSLVENGDIVKEILERKKGERQNGN